MPNATFVLKEPTSKDETLVFLLYRYNGYKLKYSTGQKIAPKFWNTEKQRAKETRQFPDHDEFNTTLNNLQARVNSDFRTLLNDGTYPTPQKLKPGLDEVLMKGTKPQKLTFLVFVKELIDSSSKRPNTIKQYRTAYSRLSDYDLQAIRKVDFETIDLDFYNDFLKFLLKKDYSTNSIGTILKNVKVFMNEAVERGLTTNI